jgi:hypothetical protein
MNKSTVGFRPRATWTHDLSQLERRFLAAMNELWFGRFESLRIERGALVLDPWPKTVRGVRFGSEDSAAHKGLRDEFELKPAVIEFFQYVRATAEGEILCLEVRRGLPVVMEIIYRPDISRGGHG